MLRTAKIIAATAALITGASAFAGVDTGTDGNDVILAGHDPVAYFTENRPVKGSAQFTAAYNGAVYRFASAENRDTFQANPRKYAPVYGGYCAFGTSLGKKFQVDGKAFRVVDGRLYVNKNLEVYETWKKDIPGNIKKADGQWPGIRNVSPSAL